MQAMFIDVDGTLSSPCYKVNGKFQIGMSDVQWADYCSKHGEDTYEWCRPVMQVKEYAMKSGNIAVNPRASRQCDIEMLYRRAL